VNPRKKDEEEDEQEDTAEYLSASELKRLRKMLELHEHTVWLWSIIGIVSKWVLSVTAAIAAIKLGLLELLKVWAK
jgi:hypothetical protein